MNCQQAETLLHALVDGELDAFHARDAEDHIATCPHCTREIAAIRELRQALLSSGLRHPAPASLRSRIERMVQPAQPGRRSRRDMLKGFGLGAALSAVAASGVMLLVLRNGDHILDEVVSAHLRSLQPGHLTDVESTDQHTVKPWFNGRLDFSPPVVDLTAQGFTLIGGRVDVVDGKAIAAIVYRRRVHVINLFVAVTSGARQTVTMQMLQGFNIRRWSEQGLLLWAISDINAEELQEFGEKLDAALGNAA